MTLCPADCERYSQCASVILRDLASGLEPFGFALFLGTCIWAARRTAIFIARHSND